MNWRRAIGASENFDWMFSLVNESVSENYRKSDENKHVNEGNTDRRLFKCFVIFPNHTNTQCWGKLLLKVMHYNIALLSKKVTNYIT